MSNTEFCLKEISGIFPELERVYIQPDEDVTRKRKVLSDIMMKMKKKREDAATSSAAGTRVPKEEKKKEERKPQPKRIQHVTAVNPISPKPYTQPKPLSPKPYTPKP